MPKSLFPGVCLSAAFLLLSVCAQYRIGVAQETKPQRMSPSELFGALANQPDFTADWVAIIDEPQMGIKYTARIRIARKKGKLRREIFPLENEPQLRSSGDKNYKLMETIRGKVAGSPPPPMKKKSDDF